MLVIAKVANEKVKAAYAKLNASRELIEKNNIECNAEKIALLKQRQVQANLNADRVVQVKVGKIAIFRGQNRKKCLQKGRNSEKKAWKT